MNKKTIKKFLPRIALVLVILAMLAVAMTSCASNTVVQNTDRSVEEWQGTTVNLESSTGFLDKLLSYIGIFLGCRF